MNYAHLHLILNHVPVFGAIATLAMAGYIAFTGSDTCSKPALWFLVLIGALTLPAYLTGEPAEETIEHLPGVTESLINAHERYALTGLILTEVLALIGIVGLLAFRKLPGFARPFWRLVTAIAVVNTVLMVATANSGGEIRHTEIRKVTPSDMPTGAKPVSPAEEKE